MVWGEIMTTEIIISLITLIGTISTVVISNIAQSSLIKYRIGELEKKVSVHNNLIDRMYKAETKIEVMENDINDLKRVG